MSRDFSNFYKQPRQRHNGPDYEWGYISDDLISVRPDMDERDVIQVLMRSYVAWVEQCGIDKTPGMLLAFGKLDGVNHLAHRGMEDDRIKSSTEAQILWAALVGKELADSRLFDTTPFLYMLCEVGGVNRGVGQDQPMPGHILEEPDKWDGAVCLSISPDGVDGGLIIVQFDVDDDGKPTGHHQLDIDIENTQTGGRQAMIMQAINASYRRSMGEDLLQ